ncbi:MAG: tRNA (uridine(34)/cytosine(34)/5-carboxymethylaminomethyluridine(34)-2'-O)-methyltransferase TrmL [Vibrionaceae bacterium]
MFHIALFEPEIPQNTGNIIRITANTGCHLHLIEPLGFSFEEKRLRRAGLDYHDLAKVTRYPDFAAFMAAMTGRRIFACTTKGSRPHTDVSYQKEDVLLFGPESRGLPENVRESFPAEQRIRVPMVAQSRSLNLANSVCVIVYEAWRQTGFVGGL